MNTFKAAYKIIKCFCIFMIDGVQVVYTVHTGTRVYMK